VNLRTVSVQTGEVLASVTVTKSIISVGNSLTVFKFFDQGTKAFESEVGFSVNEPVNYAVRTAIEQGVVEIIKEGERKGYWSFKREATPLTAPETKPEEAKKDEKPTTAVVPVKTTEEPPKQTDSPVPQKQTRSGVTVDYVNMRRESTYNSEKLMNLKPNTRVEIIRETKTHYLIKAEEREGWVVKGFIKVL
jgi:hypothetical protein